MGAPWLVEQWDYDDYLIALYGDGVVILLNRFGKYDTLTCELGETCPVFRTPHPLLKKPIRPRKR